MKSILIKGIIAKRLIEEARKYGMSLEEYLFELLTQGLDPKDKAREYVMVAQELLEEAREELEKDNIRQAAEKVWGATALVIKAHAFWKEGKRLVSHSELWAYKSILASELGEWVRVVFQQASAMHTCFYEGWCDKGDVEAAVKAVKRLVETITEKILC